MRYGRKVGVPSLLVSIGIVQEAPTAWVTAFAWNTLNATIATEASPRMTVVVEEPRLDD